MQYNVLLTVEYVGTRYFGFQLQDKPGKREITVQQVLQKALRELYHKRIRITYASRTDRGVHAKAQAVNFKTVKNIPCSNIKRALNIFLPADVRVKTVSCVPLDFHARFSSHSKMYRYSIITSKEPSVFLQVFSWQIDRPLDIAKMRVVAEKIIGKKDFSLFAKKPKGYHTCVRTVKDIVIKGRSGGIYIDVEGDGFLRNMVRNIVTFLVKVGLGELTTLAACDILEGKKTYINKPAPAGGLYLMKVKY